jgi:hypothetical protein
LSRPHHSAFRVPPSAFERAGLLEPLHPWTVAEGAAIWDYGLDTGYRILDAMPGASTPGADPRHPAWLADPAAEF